jgi:hypothetical protein
MPNPPPHNPNTKSRRIKAKGKGARGHPEKQQKKVHGIYINSKTHKPASNTPHAMSISHLFPQSKGKAFMQK